MDLLIKVIIVIGILNEWPWLVIPVGLLFLAVIYLPRLDKKNKSESCYSRDLNCDY